MAEDDQPHCCPICGCLLTLEAQSPGTRCIEPAHWQAAGLLSSHDYYPMARIAAQANIKLTSPPNGKPGDNIPPDRL